MLPRTLKTGVLALAAAVCLTASSPLAAQVTGDLSLEEERDSTYYPQPTYRPNPRAIVHERKAQARAYQRQARLASMSWYGMSNSRPMAASTPFTSRYSPVWEMPGGRPYSWYPHRWPAYGSYVR